MLCLKFVRHKYVMSYICQAHICYVLYLSGTHMLCLTCDKELQCYYHPWLATVSAMGTAVLLPPLASDGVCQGYCSATATPG